MGILLLLFEFGCFQISVLCCVLSNVCYVWLLTRYKYSTIHMYINDLDHIHITSFKMFLTEGAGNPPKTIYQHRNQPFQVRSLLREKYVIGEQLFGD